MPKHNLFGIKIWNFQSYVLESFRKLLYEMYIRHSFEFKSFRFWSDKMESGIIVSTELPHEKWKQNKWHKLFELCPI